MTVNPPNSQQPPPQPTLLDKVMPGPAPKKHSKLPYIAGGIFGVLALIGGTVAVTVPALNASRSAETSKAATEGDSGRQNPGNDAAVPDTAAEPGLPPTSGPTLDASEIVLKPKITEKQCFGSSGCLVSIKIDMTYSGYGLSEDDTFEVTYEVRGDEDGPIIGTFEVTGASYTVPEERLSTRNSGTKISIKVTDVEKLGY